MTQIFLHFAAWFCTGRLLRLGNRLDDGIAVREESGLMPAPMPGNSGGVTAPFTGTGTFDTKYGNWCVYFQ